MIYVICNEKGGAGKSSIAQNLAVFLHLVKNRDVLLVDADPQRTTAEWIEERNGTELPKIQSVELTGNISQALCDLNNRYQDIIIDCGGADTKAVRSALAVADIAITPFRPKRRDLKRAPSMADTIETAKAMNNDLQVFSVITQTPTLPNQAYRILNAKALLDSLGLQSLDHIARNLNAWDDSEEDGGSVIEYTDDKKAGSDARAIFNELMEKTNNG